MPHSLLPYNSILLSQPDPSLWYSIFLPLIINGFCFLPSFLSGSHVWAKQKMITFFFFAEEERGSSPSRECGFWIEANEGHGCCQKEMGSSGTFQFHSTLCFFLFFNKVTFLTSVTPIVVEVKIFGSLQLQLQSEPSFWTLKHYYLS